MKKVKKLLLAVLTLVFVFSLSACEFPGMGDDGKEDKDDAGKIEASVKKVTVDAGSEEIIEIENYDDLKKLKFEVEDEDIAEVEETDDGEYTVTGISEGKTSVTFSAKDCDDLTIKITVNAVEEPEPVEIEVSVTDIVLTEGDSAYFTIDNYDEFDSLDFEYDDSVADVNEIGDGEYEVVGNGEGETEIVISAEGSEEVVISVTCEAPEYEIVVNDEGYVEFGTYEQDGDDSEAEPIEWVILDENADGYLLITRYVIDVQPMDSRTSGDVTWEDCEMREWLNGDFYDTAFSDDEKELIVTVTNENPDNDYYDISGGEDTDDNVFLLSFDDVIEYYDMDVYSSSTYYGGDEELVVEATTCALDAGVFAEEITQTDFEDWGLEDYYSGDCIGKTGVLWWLRTPTESPNGYPSFCFIHTDGEIGYDLYGEVGCTDIGVRPAIFISK